MTTVEVCDTLYTLPLNPLHLAAKKALKDAEEARKRERAQGKVKAIKKFSLVSFGDEAEADEAATSTMVRVVED